MRSYPSAMKSHFHYFVKYSDGVKRKRQEDGKLIRTDSSDLIVACGRCARLITYNL